jgi:uncharacterized protein YyaL (SSP411 family)
MEWAWTQHLMLGVASLAVAMVLGDPGESAVPNDDVGRKANRLIDEKSPYLLQHAHNPVDWYPWGAEAFARAAREDKPIFLSIGYSTCHWCHVMERESFEDPEVAALMNDAFVCIKVDREERPDIDGVYMEVAQLMTGRGGWPLTIIMTPDKQPFYAATYIPKEDRFGLPGMMAVVPRIQELWSTRRDDLVATAGQVVAALSEAPAGAAGPDLGAETLSATYEQLAAAYDPVHGGFGASPKFPTPHNLLFLLRYWNRTGEPGALEMVETTLGAMRRGGVYDHVGFGFHRYSTDAEWLLPHFEKMLYDQAMLAMAYVEAYQATGSEEYARTAREILTYVLRDMTSPEGGFYSAEDADSEGEEGKFYVWTTGEVGEVLDKEHAELAVRFFGMRDGGNFEDEASGKKSGANILHMPEPLEAKASSLGIHAHELSSRIDSARRELLAVREKRIRPLRDDKILTDWNGLMIAAFAKAAAALDEPAYAEAAMKSADFVLTTLRGEDGRVLHRYREGEAAIEGNAEDYAFLVWGLLELYEATFELRYLEAAERLNEDLLERFWDGEGGGVYFTATGAETLLTRRKEVYDGAIPSSNSITMLNLLRLGRMTGDPLLEERAAAIGRAFSGQVARMAMGHTQLMNAVDFGVGPSLEVVIVGSGTAEDTAALVASVRDGYAPSKVVLLKDTDEPGGLRGLAGWTDAHDAVGGAAAAYVCRNYECDLPTTDPARLSELLTGR